MSNLLTDEISAELNSGKLPDLDTVFTSATLSGKRRGQIIIRDANYYLSERPPIEYIVDKFIAEKSLSVWFGQFGAKKTWAAIDLAVCAAVGKPWLGMITKPCNVLIIDEESGDARLANRIKDTMRGELGQGANANVPIKSVSYAGFDLLKNLDDVFLLRELIMATDAKLVIIDSLMQMMKGGDENAVNETAPVLANLRTIAERTGAAIIALHHANKMGGYRGSSAIAGSVDNLFRIESTQGEGLIKFKAEKMRDGEPFDFAGEACWDESGFYMTQSEYAEKAFLNKAQRFALDFFTEHGDGTLKELDAWAGELYAHKTLTMAVQHLINEKLLERKDGGGRRAEATYGVRDANC